MTNTQTAHSQSIFPSSFFIPPHIHTHINRPVLKWVSSLISCHDTSHLHSPTDSTLQVAALREVSPRLRVDLYVLKKYTEFWGDWPFYQLKTYRDESIKAQIIHISLMELFPWCQMLNPQHALWYMIEANWHEA